MILNANDFEAVAFDFDGTLADSQSSHEQARMMAFAEHGYAHVTEEAHKLGHTYGSRSHTIIAGVLKAAGELGGDADPDTDPTVASIVESKTLKYHEMAQSGLDAQPGAVEFVRLAAARFNGRIAVVTTAYLKEIEPFLKRHHLGGIISNDRIISADTAEMYELRPKPSPETYQLAVDRLGMTNHAQRILAVEDSPGGAEAAKLAGMNVLAVGYTNPQTVFQALRPELWPDHFIRSLEEILLR